MVVLAMADQQWRPFQGISFRDWGLTSMCQGQVLAFSNSTWSPIRGPKGNLSKSILHNNSFRNPAPLSRALEPECRNLILLYRIHHVPYTIYQIRILIRFVFIWPLGPLSTAVYSGAVGSAPKHDNWCKSRSLLTTPSPLVLNSPNNRGEVSLLGSGGGSYH